MIIINMFYLFYFIISINLVFCFDYYQNEKSIKNLKDKSELLIQNENFHLDLFPNLSINIMKV